MKSTIIAWFIVVCVLNKSTAFPNGDVVVAGTVTVVTSGADVVSRQSKSLHGHPAEQFDLISLGIIYNNHEYYLTWAIKLLCFKLRYAIIFTLIIVLTIIYTSSKCKTVLVNASVPIGVFFDNLNLLSL